MIRGADAWVTADDGLVIYGADHILLPGLAPGPVCADEKANLVRCERDLGDVVDRLEGAVLVTWVVVALLLIDRVSRWLRR